MKFVLALDLVDDVALIEEYEYWHRPGNADPQVTKQIYASGITSMEIYRIGNRLIMILETDDSFSFERKQQSDASNEHVQAWEKRMWKFQQALPFAEPGEKWCAMDKIYDLSSANSQLQQVSQTLR